MTVLLKVCGIAFVSCCAALVLGQMNGSLSFGIKVAAAVLIFGTLMVGLTPLTEALLPLTRQNSSVAEYVGIVIKALGVAMLGNISADICRDCGQSSVASGVETAAKIEIFILCVPLVTDIMECAMEIFNMYQT